MSKSGELPYSGTASAVGMTDLAAWDVHYRALAAQARGEDVVVLSVGDPDFETPRAVTDAAVAALRAGDTHYTAAGGVRQLVEAIAERESDRLGASVRPSEVVVCGGAQNALYTAMRCLADTGDEVVLFSPPYTMFEGVVAAAGAQPVCVPLDATRGHRIDFDALAGAINERTRAILLNFPHNPSGAIATPQDMRQLAELVVKHRIWLLSDEVYADLCYDRPFTSPASLPGMREQTVVIRSLSKSHAMAGWRVGWSVAPPKLCQHMRNLLNHVTYGGPGFIQAGAVVALTEELPEVASMALAYRERRDHLCELFERVDGLQCIRPESGIFCMVRIEALGLPAREFTERLFEAQRVSVLPGDAFGAGGKDWVRLALCQPIAVLSEAVERMARFAGELR